MSRISAVLRTALLLTVGIVLVVTGPAGAEELPASEGGPTDTCVSLEASADAAVEELDGLRPVDPVREMDVLGRIQTVLNQYRFEAARAGC